MRRSMSKYSLIACCLMLLAPAGCVDEQQAAADRQKITSTIGDAESASGQLQQALGAANQAEKRLAELVSQQQAATAAAMAKFDAMVAEQKARADDQQAAAEARDAASQLATEIAAQQASADADAKQRVAELQAEHDKAATAATTAKAAVDAAAQTVGKLKQQLADFDAQMSAARNPSDAAQTIGIIAGGLSGNPEIGALVGAVAIAGLGWLHQWRAKRIASGERDTFADIATVLVKTTELAKVLSPAVKEAFEKHTDDISKLQGQEVKDFVDQVQRDAMLSKLSSVISAAA